MPNTSMNDTQYIYGSEMDRGWIEDGSGMDRGWIEVKIGSKPRRPPPKSTFGSAQKRKRKEDLVDVVNLVEEVWLTKNLVDEE